MRSRAMTGRAGTLLFWAFGLLAGLQLAVCEPHAFEAGDVNRLLKSNAAVGNKTEQLLVVANGPADVETAKVYAFERSGDVWKQAFPPIGAVIGARGFAPAGQKKEGDLKTPSGVFRMGFAFGYQKATETKLPYRQATRNDYWVDDPRSPHYNQWVSSKPPAGTCEKLRRSDSTYKYTVVIEYNMEPVVPGNGSAIFLHVWRTGRQGTAGCVAVSEKDILRILAWLDKEKEPVIAMGKEPALLQPPPPAGLSPAR